MIWSEDGPSKGGFLCKPIHLISSISWHLEMGSYNWIAYIRKLNWDTMRVYTDSFSLKMEFFQHTSLSFNLLYANYPIVCRLCHLKGQIVYSGFANHLCGENLPSLLSSSHPLMGRWPPHRWRCHHHQLCGRETRSRFEIGPLKGFIHTWDLFLVIDKSKDLDFLEAGSLPSSAPFRLLSPVPLACGTTWAATVRLWETPFTDWDLPPWCRHLAHR